MTGEQQVDIPITVSPDVAEEIVEDLEENGRITMAVSTSDAPEIVEQIRWQLDNEQPLLTFTEDYDAD